MDIKEACSMFGMYSINEVNTRDIKKRYRQLMKKYHPDNCNGNSETASKISEAYEVIRKLSSVKHNLESQSSCNINIIGMEDIIDIFNKNDIPSMKGIEKGTYVALTTSYRVTDRWLTSVSILEYNIYGRYKVRLDIEVPSLNEHEVEFRVYESKVSTSISTSVKILNITIAEGLSIEYWINSKEISND